MRMPTPSSDDAFAEVKAKVDLVKVVQEHVRLTKRNKDFWGLCPFHQEDSPSFKVNPQMQSWYCFGCERSGDVFTFVELIEKTDKRGALQILAERAGVELKKLSPEQKERSDSRRRLLAMLKLAAQFYEYVLWSNPAGEHGRRLLESRMVSEETARRFQLGYAPAGRGFAEYLRAKKKSLQDAHDAGLMRSDGTDFFAERLVIPIRDERGQPLAFTARTVRADEPRKYINSRETPAYIKGRVIFALDLARDEITKKGHAVLMEGQFDVITAQSSQAAFREFHQNNLQQWYRLLLRGSSFLSLDLHAAQLKTPNSWNRYSYAWNSPLRLVDPTGLEPLDATVRTLFESYYQQSFANVQVYSNWFAHLLAGNALAITFGERIFFSNAGWQEYQAIHQLASSREEALNGMNTVGHELTHTLQARDSGLLVFFLAKYLYQWASVGFDYNRIPYEIEAYAKGKEVEDFLRAHPEVLDSVRSGGSVSISQSPSQWQDITSLSNGVFNGQLALSEFGGGIFIEGVDVTGVLTWKSRF